MRRAIVPLLAAATAACFEPAFAPTHPLDTRSTYTATLQDVPDTLVHRNQVFRARFVLEPSFNDDLRIEWRSTNPILFTVGDGSYRAEGATAAPVTVRVSAVLGRFTDARDVVVMQRVDTLEVDCWSGNCARVDAFGDSAIIFVRAVDSSGRNVVNHPYAVANRGVVRSGTPGILETRPVATGRYPFVARANGTTWVIIGADRGLDSLEVTVEQRAWSWSISGCPQAPVPVGTTFQLSTADPTDRNGNAVLSVPAVPEWSPGMAVLPMGGAATVTPTGSVTADAAGGWRTDLVVPAEGGRVAGTCSFEIVP